MKRILITGGGGAATEALNQLLGDRYEMHFADADIEAIDPVIPKSRRHEIPFAKDPRFGDEICALMERESIDLLVPGVDEELSSIAKLVDEVGLNALVPPTHFVDRNLDKAASMKFLSPLGVAPKTVPGEQAETLGFPCIVKPRCGRGSRGVSIVETSEQLAGYFSFHQLDADEAIAQELGKGPEYTVMMAADADGVLRAIVPVLVGIKRGITLRAQTVHDDVVEAACRKIHEADPVAGCYNIQLIRQDDGRCLVFEINPRVSTTICLGVAAGVDPMGIFMAPASASTDTLQSFTKNLQLKRFWVNRFVSD